MKSDSPTTSQQRSVDEWCEATRWMEFIKTRCYDPIVISERDKKFIFFVSSKRKYLQKKFFQ